MTCNLHRKFAVTRLFQNMRVPGEKIKIKIYKRNNSAKVKKKCFSNSFLEFIYKVYNNPIKWTIKYFT